jgi:hypothetical protein
VCNEKENQKFNRHTTLIHGSDLLSSKQVQIYGNRHDITEILLKVAVNTIKQTLMLVSEEKKNIDNTVYSSTTCGSICLKSSVLTNNSLVYGVVSWNLEIQVKEQLVVRKDMDVNEYERLFNITHRHKFK